MKDKLLVVLVILAVSGCKEYAAAKLGYNPCLEKSTERFQCCVEAALSNEDVRLCGMRYKAMRENCNDMYGRIQ